MAEDMDQNWQVDMEVNLFHAMRGHKPVGVNRFFQMVFIHEKLNNSINKKISSGQIWTQLTRMYDLQALNESEIIPFPNKKMDFCLPDGDYGDLMSKDYPRMSKTALGPAIENVKQEVVPTPKQSGKGGNQSITSNTAASTLASNTPEASPKRKRTRNAGSTPNSGSTTPDVPPAKRRR